MRGIVWLQAFLQALRDDQRIRQFLGPTEVMLDKALEEVASLEQQLNPRDYQLYKLVNMNYGPFRVEEGEIKWVSPIGTRVSYAKTALLRNPRFMEWDDANKELWVACDDSYYSIRRFDSDFSYVGGFSRGFSRPWDIALSEDVVAVADYNHKVVLADRKTGEWVWEFGDGSPGPLDQNKIYRPSSVCFLPNGNLLVVASYGYETTGDRAYGTVSEHDINDGSLVKIHLKYQVSGNAWNKEVYLPRYAQMVYNNIDSVWELWVSSAREYIGVFTWDRDNDEFTHKKVYGKSDQFSLFSMSVTGFTVKDYQRIYAAIYGPQVLGVLDVSSGNALNYIGRQGYENSRDASDTPGVFMSIWGVCLINDRQEIVVADEGNDRLQSFPAELVETPFFPLRYELTEGAATLDVTTYVSEPNFDRNLNLLTVSTRSLISGRYPRHIFCCGYQQQC